MAQWHALTETIDATLDWRNPRIERIETTHATRAEAKAEAQRRVGRDGNRWQRTTLSGGQRIDEKGGSDGVSAIVCEAADREAVRDGFAW